MGLSEKINSLKLSKLNYYAFWLHLLSAIGVAIAFGVLKKEINFNTTLYTYKVTNIQGDRNQDVTFDFGENSPHIEVKSYSLQALVAIIFFITALFHYYYYKSKNYYKEISRGYNRYRWVEYGITATLMIFVLALISGIKELYTVLFLVCSSIVLMSFGYFFEMSKDRKVKLSALIMGFFIFTYSWAVFLANFFPNIQSTKDLGFEIPSWVYAVLLPMIFWWFSFGLVAILNFRAYKKKGYDYSRYEKYYIFLSFMSKAFMGYYLTFGLTRDAAERS